MSFTLNPSTLENIDQIRDWAGQDIDTGHRRIEPTWWITGNGSLLSFCLRDDEGELCYIRLDAESEFTRLNTQFAPAEFVNKRRLILGMLAAFQVFIPHLSEQGSTGIITETVFSDLARWLETQGFARVEGTNDYVLHFESAVADCGSF